MAQLNEVMDNYNVIDDFHFECAYEAVLSDIEQVGNYYLYPESSSARNFDTVKELSQNCNY